MNSINNYINQMNRNGGVSSFGSVEDLIKTSLGGSFITEQKKEEFRKYLERSGVVDQLTKVLVGLYEEPEKPQNAVDFIKKCLGAPSDTDIDILKADNDDLKKQRAEMAGRIEAIQAQIEAEKAKQ